SVGVEGHQSMSIGFTYFSSVDSAFFTASLKRSSRMRARSFWLSMFLSNFLASSLFCESRFATIASSERPDFDSFFLWRRISPLTRSTTISDSQQGQVISMFAGMTDRFYSQGAHCAPLPVG